MLKSPARWLSLLALVSSAHAAPVKAPAKTAPVPAKGGAKPEVVGFWRFERDVKPEGRGAAFGPAKRLNDGVYFFNDDVPGPFIYDPLQRLSYPNSTSLSFQSDAKHNDALEVAMNTAKTSLAGQSVTLELFFKSSAEWSGPLAMKARLNDGAAEWGLEARAFEDQKQAFLQGFFTPVGGQTEHFGGGQSGVNAQVRKWNTEWRHMAFVYDAAAKTLSCYLDYCLAKTVALSGEMKWDAGSLYIGGGPGHSGFGGNIDEVRLIKGALRPSQFLRARHDPIAGVSFESLETLLPRDCGYVDLKESFGALGDGKTDDTGAFREAFRALSNQASPNHNTLYIPPGTYLVTDMLQSGRSLSVIGGGADKTVIKLRDKCPGFTRAADARAVWQVDSAQAPEVANGPVNESAAGISIGHLTIDTGKGNIGSKGLDVQSSLLQRLDDLQIRSGDGAGLVGLDLVPKGGGAALVKNLHIKGFDYGVVSGGADLAMTLEQITLEGQRLGGIKNSGGILAIRQLTSTNQATALMSMGAGSMVTLLDSALKGGSKDLTAIQSEGGLCALRVETAGYKSAIRKRELVDEKTMEWKESTIAGPKIDEYLGDQAIAIRGAPGTPLNLPIENTPEVPWGDIHKDWVSVLKFADKKSGDDWGPAIQAAIDSGARTVYFPPGSYEVHGPVHVHGKIDRLFGLHSHIALKGGAVSDDPAVIFDEPGAKRIVVIDCLDMDGLRHVSPATLVLKSSCPGHYDNGEKCGKLFMEDVEGADFLFSQPQSVWARQWNGEKHGIFSHGATIWCLGLSAGGESGVLSMEAAASTEIFGALVRPVGDMSGNRPFFTNTNSRLSVIYGTNATDPPHTLQIVDIQGTESQPVGIGNLRWIGTRGRMDLFRSDAVAPPPGH
ncbi:MAG: glycosyl hydrolase family 28-related protein [Chthoniobacter sp.]|nr:glycosyl hydrolase family 28-related protein [Chthoniobacter sp.]